MSSVKIIYYIIQIGFIIVLVSFLGSNAGIARDEDEKKLTDSINYEWTLYGSGEKKFANNIIFLREGRKSDGLVLVSPETFSKRVVFSFEIMPLNCLTVINVMLSASNSADDEALKIPYNYSGDLKFWLFGVKGYLFEFGNSSENQFPQLRKLPGNGMLAKTVENLIIPGTFNKIEVGRNLSRFWLSINGKEVFKVIDRDKLDQGSIALRIHGSFAEPGSCLLRNFEISKR